MSAPPPVVHRSAASGEHQQPAAVAAAAATPTRTVAAAAAAPDAAAALIDDADVDDVLEELTPDAKDLLLLPDCKVKRNYACAACDFFTQNPREHLYHVRDVHDEKVRIYECPSCLYASKHFQKLMRHSKMVHGDAATKPRKRRASSDDEEELQQQQQHSDAEEDLPSEEPGRPTVFKCSVCEFTSRNQNQMTRHEREEHIKTKFFRCSKCTYVTHIKARYTKHVKYHSMPMIKCDMCDFRTPYKWNLDRHCKNHNGKGAFRCSACNFTADIKQSLTVHEMNHHVPPVGQAAGLGVGRRRNKVGASDTTAAEEQQAQQGSQASSDPQPAAEDVVKVTPSKKSKLSNGVAAGDHQGKLSDFINPDDILHHSNGKVYIKNKCKLCNYKTPWDSEMAKHERKVHNIEPEEVKVKKTPRPIPNLIPIPPQTAVFKLNRASYPALKVAEIPEPSEPAMSQKDMNDICAKSANSALKDFASLFGSEDVFKNETTSKVPDLIPTSAFPSPQKVKKADFKQKNASFFDKLKEKLEQGTGCNLFCNICGHESKCLTEQVKHQKICGKETNKVQNLMPVHNISSSRCQYCRQRCKSSADLYNHLQTCNEALKTINQDVKEEVDTSSEHELKIDEDQDPKENKPHPMENRVFVWNDIMVPMDIEVDDSNYEYTEDKVDDNVSLDLSIRTQSPACSESSYLGQEANNNYAPIHHVPNTTGSTSEKIPTHGNDISVAQHKRVFKCPHCTFWASTASRFHVHIVGHLNKKPFECSLCSYRSNWRWDITKHIKLKSVRDQAHETAKVLMTDETGRRNYTKYNKYLTEIPVSSLQSSETSGGSGTRPRNHDRHGAASTSRSESKGPKLPISGDFNALMKNVGGRPMPELRAADSQFLAKISQERKRSGGDNKRTLFKCKKCNFRDASREVLLEHVKRHYEDPHQQQSQQQQQQSQQPVFPSTSAAVAALATIGAGAAAAAALDFAAPTQDLSLRGTSPDRNEASVNNGRSGPGGGGGGGGGVVHTAPFRCGHCNQVSNWKHVIQRHCRLKHSGDVRVVSSKNGQEKIEVDEQADDAFATDSPHKCPSCPFSDSSAAGLERHQSGHEPSNDRPLKCDRCRYFVGSQHELSEHLKVHGTNEQDDLFSKMVSTEFDSKKFKCTTCPYVTNSKSQYSYHRQFHKPRGGQYTCSHCSYNVSKRHLLHQHLKVHGNTSHKNGEVIEMDEAEDIEEVHNNHSSLDSQQFIDIPLVWVSKNDKFLKMFKCRFCPHVNLRKINIQEHEKMHSNREKIVNVVKGSETEHRCKDCNYVCNNAGVLSSHSKVHQGTYGVIHKLVDPTKSDEEEVKELSRKIKTYSENNNTEMEQEVEDTENSAVECTLYFCRECPARFLKENEYSIHRKLHNSWLPHTCDYCSYTSKQKHYLLSHLHVHTNEYQERTGVLKRSYNVSMNHPQPNVCSKTNSNGDVVWVVEIIEDNKGSNSTLANILNKPMKSALNVPLSGTELFQQKAEAQQKQANEMQVLEQVPESPPKSTDPQFGTLMHGNPDFIYQTYLKNGRMKEKRYKCHKCPSAFEKREQYKIHLGLHGAKQKYKCESCDYSVKYYANYVQHVKKHKYSDDANAARKSNDELEEADEVTEVTNEVSPEHCDEGVSLNLSVANQQILDILDQRQATMAPKDDEKKPFWCPYCPYMSFRRDAVDNHQKRHAVVSGVTHAYACDHCDFSVPQAHFLRDHIKLHFAPNRANTPDGYMVCDNVKLSASPAQPEASSDSTGESVIFEEKGSSDGQFLPVLSADVAERFNNNQGEKQFVDVQTGDLAGRSEASDTKSCNNVDGDSKMEVN